MKPGSKDVKIFIQFSQLEFKFLQENSYQMVEAFGLDRRIERLKGKRPISFYSWDLDCLDSIFSEIIEKSKNKREVELAKLIFQKIETGYKEIESKK